MINQITTQTNKIYTDMDEALEIEINTILLAKKEATEALANA